MLTTYKYNGETWIDIDQGTPEEIHKIMDDHNIHPFVAREMASLTPKPRVEFHDRYIYCILHFPTWKHTHAEKGENQEMDFIIGRDILITARYDTIDTLHKFSKDIEVGEILEKNHDGRHRHTHLIFTGMLRALYNGLFEELEYVDDVAEEITGQIFKGKERKMVMKISEVTRTLLDFKRVTDLHYEILETLRVRGPEIFGNDFAHEMQAIMLDYLKISTNIKSSLEMLRELRDTNDSLLSSKQNETLKKLTLIGSILFALSIAVTIYFRI